MSKILDPQFMLLNQVKRYQLTLVKAIHYPECSQIFSNILPDTALFVFRRRIKFVLIEIFKYGQQYNKHQYENKFFKHVFLGLVVISRRRCQLLVKFSLTTHEQFSLPKSCHDQLLSCIYLLYGTNYFR